MGVVSGLGGGQQRSWGREEGREDTHKGKAVGVLWANTVRLELHLRNRPRLLQRLERFNSSRLHSVSWLDALRTEGGGCQGLQKTFTSWKGEMLLYCDKLELRTYFLFILHIVYHTPPH